MKRPPVKRLLAMFVLLVSGVALLSWLAREPVEAAAHGFVAAYGLWGVGLMVWAIDSFFVQNEPALLVGYTGGLGLGSVWVAATIGSVLAGPTGWLGGRLLGRFGPVARLVRDSAVGELFERYGGRVIAVAAVGPFPYALTTWAAGVAGVPLWQVALGCLLRGPKIAFLLGVIALGWTWGAA